MIRKLAIALTILAASYSNVVQALGLGEARVSSNLNQPLVAEIELVNTGGLSDAEILPGLATREEFLKAGIDRVYFLSDVRFEVKSGENGEPIIVLTTKKPVREPFLNFLVEVIWPSGRLLREYALLIDPPLFAEDKPVAAAPAKVEPVVEQSEPASEPVVSNVVVSGDNVAVRKSVSPTAGDLAGNETYGPTNSKDTLWDIATAVRPNRDVSPQQVMLAIQDLNPDAFIDNNINKLKAGQILRLPTEGQITSRSKYAAINQVIEQNAALRKPKRKSPVSSNTKTTAPKTPNKSADAGDKLKLVVSDKDSKASDSASSDPDGTSAAGSANEEELSLTLEKLDKATLENEELSGKVDALEDQLETLQRLLTLKNDQLAGLQAQMRANELDAAEASEANADATPEETVVVAEVVETVVDTKVVNEEGEVIAEEVQVTESVAIIEEKVEAPAPVVSEPVETEDSSMQGQLEQLLHAVMANPVYQAAVAVVLVVLLLLLWLLSRSRGDKAQADSVESEEDYEESSVDEDSVLDDDLASDEEELFEGDDEALLDQDNTVSDTSGDEEKEDVIAEADVYIAYGRLDQAATILEQGISADPVRVDYRLKLLEVYKEGLEVEPFNRQLSELGAIQDQDALAKAAEIKAELESKLSEQAPVSDEDTVGEPEQLLDEDEEQALLQGDDNNFDFDTVDEGAAEAEPEASVEPEDELSGGESLDDLVDDIDGELAEELGDELGDEVDFESEELDVDLDIDLDIEDTVEEVEEDNGIDFESVDLDFDRNDTEELEPANEPVVDDAELGLGLADDLDEELSDELNHEAEIDLELDDELVVDDSTLEIDGDDLALDLDDEPAIDFESDLALEDEESASDDEVVSEELDSDEEVAVEEAGAESLELDDLDDLDITDQTLDDAAEALGDADDFEPELSEDEDFDFLEGTDEASTKLDLARAYIDMGDTEGAKEILLEVEKEGSDEQKQQARDLIDSIGG